IRFGLILPLFLLFFISPAATQTASTYQLTKEDEAFLDDLERRAFLFFWEHSGKKNGLTLDRARTTGEAPGPSEDHHNVGSIASTGFALTGFCIAADRNWVKPEEARART